ncbi:MAG: SRPBCC family protein [Saprospiraceae bacterium]|nr:SRPBCC family protein [Saprospiraceae bacterium]
MVDVITSIEIDRPAHQVASFASDPDNAPVWYVNIKEANWRTKKPLKVGSQIDFVAHFMGKKMAYTYEVIVYTPDKLVMKTAQGPFPMQTTYTFSPLGENKTKMTLRNTGSPKGFSKIFAPFMEMMMRRANTHDLKKLKMILERNVLDN